MGGSNNLKYYEESQFVNFSTNYATGPLFATGLEVNVDSGPGKYIIELIAGNGIGSVDVNSIKMKGKNPIFQHTTSASIAGSGTWDIVHTTGYSPSANPTVTLFLDKVDFNPATGLNETRPTIFGYGGSGVGSDSTGEIGSEGASAFYWQYLNNQRTFFKTRNILNYEPTLSGTWKVEVVRVTGIVTAVPFVFYDNYKTLGNKMFLPADFSYVDQPGIGSHTYKIRLSSDVSSGLVEVQNVKLVFREI